MNNSSNLSCFLEYETARYDVVLGFRSGFSLLSSFFIGCMILIIILFKKYHSFTQRLIFYLAISSLLYSLSAGFNLSGRVAYRNSVAHGFCIFFGFIEQLTVLWTLMATTCIMINIIIRVICNRTTNKLEILYVILIFIFPFFISCIPFIEMSYGPDEVFCWIRVYNEDCSDFDFGIALRYGMYYLPMFLLMLLLIVLYIPVICILSWKRNHWVGTYDPKAAAVHNMIATEIRSLVYYPIVIMLFNVIPLVKLVYSTAGNNNVASYALSLASYIVYPFQGLFMTLIFTLDPETRNKLNISSITGACMELCKPKRSIESYPVMESSTYTDSLIKTSRSTLPVGRINSTMINDVEKD